jgi:transposase
LRHGMIRASFIPPRFQRELRDLTRRRKQMVRAAAEERNRVQKVLEDANVKIGDVLSDVFGLSGQLMLEALVAGQKDALDVAQLARGNARKKIAELTAALEGHQMRDSHRFLITRAMRHMAFLAEEIEALDQAIATSIGHPDLGQSNELLQTIPGIRAQAAAAMLAEGGPNMKQFPGPGHFSSWSGVAPGNNESAGTRKRAPTLRGNPHMKTALVESAWSASRTNGSEFQDRYNRLKPRIGHKRAIMAVAHVLALRVHEVLSAVLPYRQARSAASQASVKRLIRHHNRRLRHLHGWLEKYPV